MTPLERKTRSRYSQLDAKLRATAKAKAWKATEIVVDRLAAGNEVGKTSHEAVVKVFSIGNNLTGMDIEALVFVVMMQVTKEADEDLKQIMDGVKAINEVKAGMRKLVALVAKDSAGNGDNPKPDPKWRHYLATRKTTHGNISYFTTPARPYPTGPGPGATPRARALYAAELASDLQQLKDGSQEDEILLQAMMDRRSKMLEALSNLLKKISDTDAGILQNIK